jgi:hypothetical protein
MVWAHVVVPGPGLELTLPPPPVTVHRGIVATSPIRIKVSADGNGKHVKEFKLKTIT